MTATTTIPPVWISGKGFYTDPLPASPPLPPARFMVRGVALSTAKVPGLKIDDILADEHHDLMTSLILPHLVDFGVNVVRIYQVDSSRSHQKSMASLAEAGIYAMVGLVDAAHSIDQMTGSYDYTMFLRATQIVDEFQAYDNTFCFSIGNEVEFPGQQAAILAGCSDPTDPAAIVAQTVALELIVAQAMKSFARDIKAHMKDKSYRAIPVGAAMQDGPQVNWNAGSKPPADQTGLIGTDTIAQYYTAGDAADGFDYIGINSYRYVTGPDQGPAAQAYDALVEEAALLPVPVFLTESGGYISTERDWADVPTFYTSAVGGQLSGQIAFELLQENPVAAGNYYGLYTYTDTPSGPVLDETDYGGVINLEAQFAAAEQLSPPAAASTPVRPTIAPISAGSPPFDIAWPTPSITVINYATCPVQVVQNGVVMGWLPAALSNEQPASKDLYVLDGVALSLQGLVGGAWDAVCGLPASAVTAGIVVKNNVSWGNGVVCSI